MCAELEELSAMVDEDKHSTVRSAADAERAGTETRADSIASAIRRAVSANHDIALHALVPLKPGSIPKTSSGKVQRHACRAGLEAATLDVLK